MKLRPEVTVEKLRERVQIGLPHLVGLQVIALRENALLMRLPVRAEVLAPNGYLHAASIVALADTCCGFACAAHLPEGAINFTTIELKSNFLGTRHGWHDRGRGGRGASRPYHPRVGRACKAHRIGQDDRTVSLHADGALAAQAALI